MRFSKVATKRQGKTSLGFQPTPEMVAQNTSPRPCHYPTLIPHPTRVNPPKSILGRLFFKKLFPTNPYRFQLGKSPTCVYIRFLPALQDHQNPAKNNINDSFTGTDPLQASTAFSLGPRRGLRAIAAWIVYTDFY